MATAARDPRDVVTPEAFRVADHLIGTPLAKPSRRLGAILIDLLLVVILVQLLDAFAFLLALVGAFFVFRLSRTKKEGRWYKRFYRHGLGCFAALLTFIGLVVAVSSIGNLVGIGDDEDNDSGATIETDSGTVLIEGMGLVETAVLVRRGAELGGASRPGQRDTLADAIVEQLLDAGLSSAQIRMALTDLIEDEVYPPDALVAIEAAIETTTARRENRAPRSAEQLRAADSVAAVRAAEDLAAGDTLSPEDSAKLARADSIRILSATLDSVNEELDRVQDEREADDERNERGAFRWVLSSISDELGLGIGWLGLYFTAFTVLGGGQTPGKRVFRLRVIRLDGRPIGWWNSLQRFGGYSASVFTGMLGFAEMLWDDNRQALQDKLAFTVVIQEPKKGERGATPPLDVVADQIAAGETAEPARPAPAPVESPAPEPDGPASPAEPTATDDPDRIG